jgi:hypothetical protein
MFTGEGVLWFSPWEEGWKEKGHEKRVGKDNAKVCTVHGIGSYRR